MIFTVGAPAIPALRFLRIRRQFGAADRHPGPPFSVWPVLLVGLAASAAGEMAGYCLGAGDVKEKLAGFEFHRIRHLAKRNMQPEGEP
jgi:membrane protein YqaA with SNARE-associated domain